MTKVEPVKLIQAAEYSQALLTRDFDRLFMIWSKRAEVFLFEAGLQTSEWKRVLGRASHRQPKEGHVCNKVCLLCRELSLRGGAKLSSFMAKQGSVS